MMKNTKQPLTHRQIGLFRGALVIALCAWPFSLSLTAGARVAQEIKPALDRMEWFREAKFGMFIHWGVYSELAGYYNGERGWKYAEHIMDRSRIPVDAYERIAAGFNPVDFDAAEWVQIAKDAGMKYMVITAKHHDGFCMYDSDFTDYDIVQWTPFQRDPIQELADACKAAGGIRFCIYYSHMDWHYKHGHPDYDDYRLNQVIELVDKYDPGILWFDDYGFFGNERLLNALRARDVDLLLNERVTRRDQGDGDFTCSEQHIPGKTIAHDWETCMTLNDSWGYHKGDHNWKSTADLLKKMIDVNSKGGNFLLNIGPDGQGVIPVPSVERLREVGAWMQVNGEAIYGSTAAPFERPAWGRYTKKPGKLYAHVFQWPADAKLNLSLSGQKVSKAYLLADKQQTPLLIQQTEAGVSIDLPTTAPDSIASVIVIE